MTIRPLALIAVFALCVGCAGPDAQHTLWHVKGTSNDVYLLGSVHLLRASDYPLPDAFETVYDDAEILVLELDLDDIAMEDIAAGISAAGFNSSGLLEDSLSESSYKELQSAVSELSIDTALIDRLEPWLAAMTIMNIQMQSLGFSPEHGIDAHYMQRAVADDKPVVGLETLAEQISLFDDMPAESQQQLLMKTLDDMRELETDIASLITAWRAGDTAALEHELIDELEEFPAFYESFIVRRNTRWVERVVDMLDDDEDYLVIVGAMHLVGSDGLPAQLKSIGFNPEQL